MRLPGRLQLAPTPRVIKQLGLVERFAGEWTIIGKTGVFTPELESDAAMQGAEAALALDSSSPPGLTSFLITVQNSKHEGNGLNGNHRGTHFEIGNHGEHSLLNGHPLEEMPMNSALRGFLSAYRGRLPVNTLGFLQIYQNAAGEASFNGSPWRQEVEHFRAPGLHAGSDELVFPTVSPFLVEPRMNELLAWAQSEIENGTHHPLIVAPLFHLLLLQIHPFPKANHRLALAVLWHILSEHGFPFIRFQHLTPVFQARSKLYFSTLRQAEKTAGTNWSTMNIWLEFFFDCLLEVTRGLRELGETLLDETLLTDVQRRILDVVRNRGTASREIITQETGLHVSTVKYNLSLLAERGHLTRDGIGRATHYKVG